MNLVLGATGYIGGYLSRALHGTDTVLHCRSADSLGRVPDGSPYVVEDLAMTRRSLTKLNPETVYILARPLGVDAAGFLDFGENLQWLLQEWVERGCLTRIVFFSSQLVYATPVDTTALTVVSPTGPESPHDFHKLEMESFLGVLGHCPGVRSIEILRLPLVAGRPCPAGQAEFQFLFKWESAYRRGLRWCFRGDHPRESEWGNSWVHIDDLVNLLIAPPAVDAPKCRVLQPVSGHFTYQQLHGFFLSRDHASATGELHLPRTSFFLQDNAGMRARPLPSAFETAA